MHCFNVNFLKSILMSLHDDSNMKHLFCELWGLTIELQNDNTR